MSAKLVRTFTVAQLAHADVNTDIGVTSSVSRLYDLAGAFDGQPSRSCQTARIIFVSYVW